jgi:hypothetical protein
MTPDHPTVRPGTRWQHHSGRYYRVMLVTNLHSDQPEKFPLMVTYMDEQQRTWSRPLVDFVQKMTPVGG